ncbi:MAG: division/cell wall cluster transcriptional repressor MraZ [Thermoleophilia bacterium]
MPAFRFWGHFQHSLDSKNRVAIPAKFRQQISDGKVVVTEYFEGCLAVYPAAEWERFIKQELSGMSSIDSRHNRDVRRMLYGSADESQLDKQGRISLSAYHLDAAGIGKEVIFKGVNDWFEIWDRKKWEAHRAAYKKREAEEE